MTGVQTCALPILLDVCKTYESSDKTGGGIEEVKSRILDLFDKYSSQGYRVLGLAYKFIEDGTDIQKQKAEDMVFAGLLLFIDPLKDDIKDVVAEMNRLGVSLKTRIRAQFRAKKARNYYIGFGYAASYHHP